MGFFHICNCKSYFLKGGNAYGYKCVKAKIWNSRNEFHCKKLWCRRWNTVKAGTSLDDALTGLVKYKANQVIDFWLSTPTNHITGDHNKWDKLPAMEQLSKEERLLVDIINCFMGRIKE